MCPLMFILNKGTLGERIHMKLERLNKAELMVPIC